MSSTIKKKLLNKNEKEEKKLRSEKLISDVEKKSSIKSIDNVKDIKKKNIVVNNKSISGSKPSKQTIVQNKTKAETNPLKGNHQININKKVIKDEPKASIVKKTNSQLILSKKPLPVSSEKSSNKNNTNRKPHTNVTVNSPKHKRNNVLDPNYANPISPKRVDLSQNRQTKKVENNTNELINAEKYNISLNNHKRYRTRTLEPEEIKIVDKFVQNIEYSEPKISIEKKLIAQPKSFFVTLEDKVNKLPLTRNKEIENAQQENIISDSEKVEQQENSDSLSYEDDFESYESDFDSYNSTNGLTKSSNSDVEELSSTTSGLSSFNNIGQNKVKENVDQKFIPENNEENKYSSLTEAKPEKRNDNNNVNKNETTLHSFTSLTDEGFDENSIALSGTSVIKASGTIDESHHFVSDSSKKTYEDLHRAQDLKELIILDDVKYSLFEMFPMSYDTFITIHGKSNMNQVSCQSNEDYLDEDIQTDTTLTENKWTQYPIKFSNHKIIYSEINKNKNGVKKSIPEYSPLEIYQNQKHGCGSDDFSTFLHLQKRTMLTGRTNFVKLTKFINKAGRIVLNYLNDHEKLFEENESKLNNNIDGENKVNLDYKNYFDTIKDQPIEKMYFSNLYSNIILTIHPARRNGEEQLNSIICIWSLRNSEIEPLKMLSVVGNVKCCAINGGLTGLLVAGLDDGNLSAWNLNEHDMWFKNLCTNKDELENTAKEKETLRICSFHSGYDINKSSGQKRYLWGSSVEVLFSKSITGDDSSSEDASKNQQVYLLQEFGLLTIWIVVYKSPGYKNVADVDYYHSQWSTLSLIKTKIVDLNKFVFKKSLDIVGNRDYQHRNSQNNNNKGKQIVKLQEKKKGIMRAFDDEDSDIDVDTNIGRNEKILTEDQFYAPVLNWEKSIICTIMKEHESTKNILIAFRNCEILNYSPKNINKNANIYTCEDDGSIVTCIETCPGSLPYFFSGCSNNVIHLYTEKSTKPIRNFYCDQNDTALQTYKQFTDKSYNMYNFGNVDMPTLSQVKSTFWVDWLKSSPHIFFTFFNDGKVVMWDLFNSDVMPKLLYNFAIDNNKADGKKNLLSGKILPVTSNSHKVDNKLLMILHFSNNNVQVHHLKEKYFEFKFKDKKEELSVLKTYFELL